MKIYRNNNHSRDIGVKFDNLRYSQVQITAVGSLDDEVEIDFVQRNRETAGDFNADPAYMKDYDADMNRIFADLLEACDNDKTDMFVIRQIYSDECGIKVGVSKATADDACDFDDLIGRLLCYLSASV